MKKKYIICSCLVLFSFIGCKTLDSNDGRIPETFPEFYKEGHRGARGLMPENTIPSMKKAIDEGANVIELDVHISKDKEVVVAHDPYINRIFSLLPDGSEIPEEDSRKYLIYQMEYPQIRKFDVGSRFHEKFSDQEKMETYIPLLSELIDSVEAYIAEKDLPEIIYNIEIKANTKKDGEYQPAPEEYVELVMEVVKNSSIRDRFYVQSFDIRQLQEVKKNYPEVVIGFLTSDREASFEENIEKIGFDPDIYSPNYKMATEELIQKTHNNNMKFIPWTVNTSEDMDRLIKMQVDGIITDYPNILTEVLDQ